MSNPASTMPPGFRFHPTDEELILHYLRRRAASVPCPVSIIADVDVYKFDPWELPSKAAMVGNKEWYFFTPRDRKYPNGLRPNRAAASGYWKATGTDKPIRAATRGGGESIGVKKALVFYRGKPPKGIKTDWIMHEYRLAGSQGSGISNRPLRPKDFAMRLDDWVLCRIYNKSNRLCSDRDRDDSVGEDAYLAASASTSTSSASDIHRSSSLSEFLNLLFDDPSEILVPEPAAASAYMTSAPSAAAAEGSAKRGWPEGSYSAPPATKRLNGLCGGVPSCDTTRKSLLCPLSLLNRYG